MGFILIHVKVRLSLNCDKFANFFLFFVGTGVHGSLGLIWVYPFGLFMIDQSKQVLIRGRVIKGEREGDGIRNWNQSKESCCHFNQRWLQISLQPSIPCGFFLLLAFVVQIFSFSVFCFGLCISCFGLHCYSAWDPSQFWAAKCA